MPKMLFIDDEESAASILKELIELQGWSVEMAATGLDGLQHLENFKYDLVLLDWNLPDLSGLDVCRRFRKNGGTTPIIFLTARSDLNDKETGLDAGGDDYLTKPFEVRELMARIRSLRRRPVQIISDTIEVQSVQFDTGNKIIKMPGKEAQLSPTEANLLEFLFRNRNAYFSASQLFESIWASNAESSETTVRVHMTGLRKKLSEIGAPDLIKTVRGLGYIIEDPPQK